MKVFISADLEGVTGVVGEEQLSAGGQDYDRARKRMTEEVNAAANGAIRGGATRVVVNDAHGPMTNILLESLQADIELITGSPKPGSMMAGLTKDFDIVFLVGYHAKKGSPGILSHSYVGSKVADIKVNDRSVGEAGLNGYYAGHFGVPVGLVTGDDQVVAESMDLFKNVKTAIVKWMYSRTAALCIHPQKSKSKIEQQAYLAIKEIQDLKPLVPKSPIQLEVAFLDYGMAEKAAIMPGASLLKDHLTVSYRQDDMGEIFRGLQCMLHMI